jgi:hypothetical protein
MQPGQEVLGWDRSATTINPKQDPSDDQAQKVLLNRLGLNLPQRLRRIDEVTQM